MATLQAATTKSLPRCLHRRGQRHRGEMEPPTPTTPQAPEQHKQKPTLTPEAKELRTGAVAKKEASSEQAVQTPANKGGELS